jgi:hypothetical protein
MERFIVAALKDIVMNGEIFCCSIETQFLIGAFQEKF